MLAGERNLVLAAEKVLAMGPKTLVVKHGEYGATAFFCDRSFAMPNFAGLFARRRCRWPRWSIRPVREILSRADSTATSPRSRSLRLRSFARRCSMAA